MKLYVAMWVRGIKGNDATAEEVSANKEYAISVADRMRAALFPYHEVVCPHEDPILNFIDENWLKDRGDMWVTAAIRRCYDLLDDCDVLVVFDRGFESDGIRSEKMYASSMGIDSFTDYPDLTDETLKQLILFLNEKESLDETVQ